MPRPDAHVLECAFASNPDDKLAQQVWTNITPYLDVAAGVRISRGRTDEFSEIQPSTMALTLRNTDGRFTSNRAASPYYPNVKTGKRIRYGVLWKGNGKQIDTDPSFNGAAPFKGSNDLYGWESVGSGTTLISSSTLFAQSGANSMRLLLPAGVAGASKVRKIVYGFIPGRQYTASLYIRVGTGDPAMTFGVTGFGTSSTTTLNAFEREQVTFTATDRFHEIYVQTNATSVGTEDIFVDAVQIEEGASATTFDSTAGIFSWRFTGDVNEWPTGWEGGPAQYAVAQITATDRFKRLRDLGEFRTTLEEDVLDDIPFAYYPLTEPGGVDNSTNSAGDISGNSENPLIPKQYGSGGTITFGSTPGVVPFYVEKETTVAINPVDQDTGQYLRASLKAPPPLAPFGTPGATVNVFAQESVSPVSSGPLAIISGTDGSWFGVRKRSNGNITACFYDGPTATFNEIASGFGLTSDRPRMYTAVLDIPSAGNGRVAFYSSAGLVGSALTFAMPQGIPTWYAVSVGGRGSEMFRGYISHAAFFNHPVTTAAFLGWQNSAFLGTDGAGSTSYSRLNKLCVYSALETPLRFSGVFTPQLVGPLEIEGQPMDAMKKIYDTEEGQFFIRGDGQCIFRLRNYRYNRTANFSIDSDQLDPDAIAFRGDDFGLVNDVTAKRSDGAQSRFINQGSVDDHGRIKAEVEAIPTTDDALKAIAAWRANTYGEQRNRITGVKFSLLNNAAITDDALLMDLSVKITVTSLPTQAPTSTLDLIVEGWSETVSEDAWLMELSTSPAEVYDVWQLGVAGHSELGLTTRIGH